VLDIFYKLDSPVSDIFYKLDSPVTFIYSYLLSKATDNSCVCLLSPLKMPPRFFVLLALVSHSGSAQNDLSPSQWLFIVAAEGSGHHGFDYFTSMFKEGEPALNTSSLAGSMLREYLFGALVGGPDQYNGVSQSRWYSDAFINETSALRGGRTVIAKVNTSACRQLLRDRGLDAPSGFLTIDYHPSYPTMANMGVGEKERTSKKNWFLDHESVREPLRRRLLGNALGNLVGILDRRFPTDPRSVTDALSPYLARYSTALAGGPKFLFVLRRVEGMVASHPGFDGGPCRHALVMSAMQAYFSRVAGDLPKGQWRTLWYENMGGASELARATSQLRAWLGFPHYDTPTPLADATWHASTKEVPTESGPVGWAAKLQRGSATDGLLFHLLDPNQALDDPNKGPGAALRALSRRPSPPPPPPPSSSKPTPLVAFSSSLNDPSLWDPLWGCPPSSLFRSAAANPQSHQQRAGPGQ